MSKWAKKAALLVKPPREDVCPFLALLASFCSTVKAVKSQCKVDNIHLVYISNLPRRYIAFQYLESKFIDIVKSDADPLLCCGALISTGECRIYHWFKQYIVNFIAVSLLVLDSAEHVEERKITSARRRPH